MYAPKGPEAGRHPLLRHPLPGALGPLSALSTGSGSWGTVGQSLVDEVGMLLRAIVSMACGFTCPSPALAHQLPQGHSTSFPMNVLSAPPYAPGLSPWPHSLHRTALHHYRTPALAWWPPQHSPSPLIPTHTQACTQPRASEKCTSGFSISGSVQNWSSLPATTRPYCHSKQKCSPCQPPVPWVS